MPGNDTIEYGGNTSCITVTTSENDLLLMDCGSGARELGSSSLCASRSFNAYVLLGGPFWDRIQGLPFCSRLYTSHSTFSFCLPCDCLETFKSLLELQMEYDYFPVDISSLNSTLQYQQLAATPNKLAGFTVEPLQLSSQPCCFGYRIVAQESTAVFLLDLNWQLARSRWNTLVNFCQGADLLVTAPYASFRGHEWQETPELCLLPAQLAQDSSVARLALTHYFPTWTDQAITDYYEAWHQSPSLQQAHSLRLIAVKEGMEISL